LEAGGMAVGTWVVMKSSEACEAAAASGFDFVCMDSEHGSFDAEDAVEMIRAVEAGGATPVLRLPDSSPIPIQKALDAGAAVILVSEVRTGEEAAQIVRAAKYPPAGRRGVDPFVRSTKYGAIDWEEYTAWAEKNIMVWVMIENTEAVENIDSILSSGVDAVYVGPCDLAMSMGLGGDVTHPDVLSAQDRVAQLALSRGVDVVINLDCIKVGLAEAEPEEVLEAARAWRKKGCRLVTVLDDRKCLIDAYKKVLPKFKGI